MKRSWLLLSILPLMAYAAEPQEAEDFDLLSLLEDDYEEMVAPQPSSQSKIAEEDLTDDFDESEEVQAPPVQKKTKAQKPVKLKANGAKKSKDKVAATDYEESEEIQAPPVQKKAKAQKPVKSKSNTAKKSKDKVTKTEKQPQAKKSKGKAADAGKLKKKAADTPAKKKSKAAAQIADMSSDDDNSDDQMNTQPMQQQNSSGMQQQSTQPMQDRMFQYRPSLQKHYYYVAADALYWKMNEAGQDYVIPNSSIPSDTLPFGELSGQIGRIKEVKYSMEPGFRVAGGVNFMPDYWDLEGQYTFIRPHGSNSVSFNSSDPEDILIGTLPQFTDAELASASAEVTLKYHVADLMLAKRFQCSKQILVRLAVGGTGAWLDQHFKANYYPQGTGFFNQNKLFWKFQGGGLKIGFDTDWFFGKGFSLLGKFYAGLLYGHYRNQFSNKSYSDGRLVYTYQDAQLNDQRFASTLQFMLGPSWGMRWGMFDVNIFTGWEMNLWYNVQYLLRSAVGVGTDRARESLYSNEALGMQGFTGRVQVNF